MPTFKIANHVLANFLLIAGFVLSSSIWASNDSQFVGNKACESCHLEEYQAWQNSHHDLAMQEANADTVLGNFNQQTYKYFDVVSTFTNKDGKYFVETDGSDGKLATYEIAYVFGVYPLQQYLIEFPGGRYQSLAIAWDTRTKEEGGQRWFHLYPDEEIKHDNPLHWTGLDQNWNYMCAECHSTNLKKNFDQDTNTFNTSWSEINVSCEACHGPGAKHIAWAQQKPEEQKNADSGLLNLDNTAAWIIDPNTGLAARSPKRTSHLEIEMCARCHSRRSIQSEDYHHGKPLLDTHLPATLSAQLYHPDGQINDEVYVYGSFLQSKMYQKGVTCSDCHEPHTLKLRAEGNNLCSACHLATKFDVPAHHFHQAESNGAECIACHMPEKNYMVIDARGDHSFRIPRPDLSLTLGTPNACIQCHQDQTNEWAANAVKQWYPDSPQRKGMHYGEMLAAGRLGTVEANQLLIALAGNQAQPAIVRATATAQLQDYLNPLTLNALNERLHDTEALIRFNAIGVADGLPADLKLKLLAHLLDDELRMIRIEAARVLASSKAQINDAGVKAKLEKAIEEYIAALRINADRPEALVSMGNLYASLQSADQAQAAYEKAIEVDPTFISAYVNLADLYRARNLDHEGKRYLLSAIEQQPDAAAPHHALGLLYVRQQKIKDALTALQKSVDLDPTNSRYKYVYAVALNSVGQSQEAINVMTKAHQQRSADREVLYALISFHHQAGDMKTAKRYAETLVKVAPWDREAKKLLQNL